MHENPYKSPPEAERSQRNVWRRLFLIGLAATASGIVGLLLVGWLRPFGFLESAPTPMNRSRQIVAGISLLLWFGVFIGLPITLFGGAGWLLTRHR